MKLKHLNDEQVVFLADYFFHEFDAEIYCEEDLYDWVTSLPPVGEYDKSERRWWIDVTLVVEIKGRYFAYNHAITTGDETPIEKGWTSDGQIWEVDRFPITSYTWKRKGDPSETNKE